MRLAIFTALATIVLANPLEPAKAGGVVIHYRDVAKSAASRGIESVVLPAAGAANGHQENANAGVTTQSSSPGDALTGGTDALTGTSGAGSTGTANAGQAAGVPGGGKAPPGVPGTGGPLSGDDPTAPATASVLPGSVARFAADDGLADFEATGCGGATSARGPIGLLPFAVAALALLRRRR